MPTRQADIINEPARLNIDMTPGRVNVDMSGLEDNTARKDIISVQQDYAADAFTAAQQGIQTIVSEGQFVGKQPSGTKNRIGELARQRVRTVVSNTSKRSPLPPKPVQVSGDPGNLQIDWTPHNLEINWSSVQRPVIELEPEPYVEVDLIQEPSLHFSVTELTIPAESGQFIDTEA